jgi:hypothetical protein
MSNKRGVEYWIRFDEENVDDSTLHEYETFILRSKLKARERNVGGSCLS